VRTLAATCPQCENWTIETDKKVDIYGVMVVLENSNMAQLASNRYLTVHAQPQEDRYDTDDTSA